MHFFVFILSTCPVQHELTHFAVLTILAELNAISSFVHFALPKYKYFPKHFVL